MAIKMGLHRHTGKRDAELKRYVDLVRPQFVKFLDGFPQALAEYCHERGTRVIGRVYFQKQELGAAGGRQLREVVDTARRNPWVDYWEFHNEDWQRGNDLARYSELSIEFMRAIADVGRKAAIGCFSTGQPEVSEWVRFFPALQHAAEHGHAVAVHEYGGGPIGAKWGVGRNQWNGGTPVTDDACDNPNIYYLGWWCLRYRRAVAEWRQLGITRVPDILITEALIDDIQPRGGGQGKGWRDFKNQHPSHVGDYADQWAWYCRELSRDPYVIGAVDFGWATADPTWGSFDLSQEPDMLNKIIEKMRASDAAPAPQPADPVSRHLSARMPGRFSDVRATMPRHTTRAYAPLDVAKLTGIAVHHSATSRETTVEAVARFHVDGNGWAGIGYHFVIRRGHVYYVGDIDTARAHVSGRNHELIGICVMGTFTDANPAPEDTTALRDLIAGLDAYLSRALPVDGHGGWAMSGHGTACPGRLAPIARAIRGAPAPAPGGPRYDKIVWAIEEARRILEREGLTAESAFIRDQYEADAKRRRGASL